MKFNEEGRKKERKEGRQKKKERKRERKVSGGNNATMSKETRGAVMVLTSPPWKWPTCV